MSIRIIVTMICCLCLAVTASTGQTQKKQLTPVQKTAKIALLDNARLRKEYKALCQIGDSAKHEWGTLKNKEDHIKQGSMDNGKRQGLLNACENEKRQLLHKRVAIVQQYELKIREAIAKVVAEGGYTDVQPIYKNKPVPNGTDITDKVLNKLN